MYSHARFVVSVLSPNTSEASGLNVPERDHHNLVIIHNSVYQALFKQSVAASVHNYRATLILQVRT